MVGGYPRSMEQLHIALQNSFQGIRQDIDDIKNAHAFLVNANKELADALEKVHGAAVTTDQLNLLKIKVQDAVGEAKRAGSVEKRLGSALESIDTRFRAFKGQFVLASDFEKKVESIAAKLDGVASKMQQRLQTDEFNTFVDELNSELRRLRALLEKLEGEGGRVIDMRIDELRRELAAERRGVGQGAAHLEGTQGIREIQEKFVLASSMERVLDDINKEFDAIKKDVQGLHQKVGLAAAGRSFAKESAPPHKGSPSRKPSKTVFDDDDLHMEVIKTEGGPMERRQQRPLFWGNVFIALAFTSLFVSVLLTFLRKTPWDGYVLWGGGIGFMVLGTILRIIGIVKGRNE